MFDKVFPDRHKLYKNFKLIILNKSEEYKQSCQKYLNFRCFINTYLPYDSIFSDEFVVFVNQKCT